MDPRNLWKISTAVLMGMAVCHAQGNAPTKNLKIPSENIESVRFMHNMAKAKDVIIAFTETNSGYLTQLYGYIKEINSRNNTKIRLVVSIPDNYGPENQFSSDKRPSGEPFADFKSWQDQLKKIHNIPTAKNLENLIGVLDRGIPNPWLQDLGEILTVKLKNQTNAMRVFFDVNRNGGLNSSPQAKSIFPYLMIPTVNAENYKVNEPPDSGNFGGNIEATHENQLYVGNTMSLLLQNKLASFARQKPLVLDTQFLQVGHVDEIVAIAPSNDECGVALVYADPLAAINLAIVNPQKYRYEIGKRLGSISYFLKSDRKNAKPPYKIDDFDLSLPLRKTSDQIHYDDWSIYKNLAAYKSIEKSVEALRSQSKCLKKTLALPTIFDLTAEMETVGLEKSDTRNLTPLSSAINMVVLDKQIVIAEPFFKDEILQRLSTLVPRDQIHVVDQGTSELERGSGSLHCSTYVIRE